MDSLEAWLPVILVPALTLSILAQLFVQFVFSRSGFVKTKMSGYAVARHVLDGAAMYDVPVEQVPGQLSDHYDARRRILQLSGDVYHGRNVAAVATAAHEACHALQNCAAQQAADHSRNSHSRCQLRQWWRDSHRPRRVGQPISSAAGPGGHPV